MLEYRSNYSDTLSLWFYSKDEETLKIQRQHLENTEADKANRILKKYSNCCAIKVSK